MFKYSSDRIDSNAQKKVKECSAFVTSYRNDNDENEIHFYIITTRGGIVDLHDHNMYDGYENCTIADVAASFGESLLKAYDTLESFTLTLE